MSVFGRLMVLYCEEENKHTRKQRLGAKLTARVGVGRHDVFRREWFGECSAGSGAEYFILSIATTPAARGQPARSRNRRTKPFSAGRDLLTD
jgi:hypothetical protein